MLCHTQMNIAARMARHTRSGVAGIGTSVTFNSDSASTTALITAGVEPTLQAILTVLHPVIAFDGGEINLFTEDGSYVHKDGTPY